MGCRSKRFNLSESSDPDKKFVKAVIDINPEKQNKFIAVTGHPIYSPEKLTDLNCENIIVMNENYCKEITALIQQLGIKSPTILSL